MSVHSQGGAAQDPRGSPMLLGSLLGMGRTRGPPCMAVRAQHRVACTQICTWGAQDIWGPLWAGGALAGCWPMSPGGTRASWVNWDPPQCHFKGDLQIFHCCRRAPCALRHPGAVDFGAPSLPGSDWGSAPSVRVLSTRGEPVPPVSPFPLPSRHAEGFES